MKYNPKSKTEGRAIERKISESYRRNCCGIEIDIMDIGAVFRVGREAILADQDLDAAIVAFVQTIRKN